MNNIKSVAIVFVILLVAFILATNPRLLDLPLKFAKRAHNKLINLTAVHDPTVLGAFKDPTTNFSKNYKQKTSDAAYLRTSRRAYFFFLAVSTIDFFAVTFHEKLLDDEGTPTGPVSKNSTSLFSKVVDFCFYRLNPYFHTFKNSTLIKSLTDLIISKKDLADSPKIPGGGLFYDDTDHDNKLYHLEHKIVSCYLTLLFTCILAYIAFAVIVFFVLLVLREKDQIFVSIKHYVAIVGTASKVLSFKVLTTVNTILCSLLYFYARKLRQVGSYDENKYGEALMNLGATEQISLPGHHLNLKPAGVDSWEQLLIGCLCNPIAAYQTINNESLAIKFRVALGLVVGMNLLTEICLLLAFIFRQFITKRRAINRTKTGQLKKPIVVTDIDFSNGVPALLNAIVFYPLLLIIYRVLTEICIRVYINRCRAIFYPNHSLKVVIKGIYQDTFADYQTRKQFNYTRNYNYLVDKVVMPIIGILVLPLAIIMSVVGFISFYILALFYYIGAFVFGTAYYTGKFVWGIFRILRGIVFTLVILLLTVSILTIALSVPLILSVFGIKIFGKDTHDWLALDYDILSTCLKGRRLIRWVSSICAYAFELIEDTA